jgi:hypothetical protein
MDGERLTLDGDGLSLVEYDFLVFGNSPLLIDIYRP